MEFNQYDLQKAEHQYWLARVEIEMPTPDDRTLIQLGRAAYLLSKSEEETNV